RGEHVVGCSLLGLSRVSGADKTGAARAVDRMRHQAGPGGLSDPDPTLSDSDAVAEWLTERVPEPVTWSGWEMIDAYESSLGESMGRPRVKLVRLAELLEASRGPAG